MTLARAVRKAVISSAFRNARGAPLLSKSVRLPFGVVDCALETDCGVSLVVVEEEANVCCERDEVMDAVSAEDDALLPPAPAKVTILTPVPSLLYLQ